MFQSHRWQKEEFHILLLLLEHWIFLDVEMMKKANLNQECELNALVNSLSNLS
jgi:hypothetical protein